MLRCTVSWKTTHRVVEVADCYIKASSSFICLGVMNKHGLQAVVETNEPILPIVLLRLLDWLSVDRMNMICSLSGDVPTGMIIGKINGH